MIYKIEVDYTTHEDMKNGLYNLVTRYIIVLAGSEQEALLIATQIGNCDDAYIIEGNWISLVRSDDLVPTEARLII